MRTRIITLLLTFFTISNTTPSVAWNIVSEQDDFGSTAVFASTYFVSGIGNTDIIEEAFEYDDFFSLYIRCLDKKIEVYMAAQSELENTSAALVKFGNGSAKKWTVSRSTSKDTIFFSKPASLVSSIIKVNKFYVRAGGNSGYVAVNFNTAGLSSHRIDFKKGGCKI